MNIGLAIVSRAALLPWKRTERVIVEAHRRGFEVGLALDPRDSDGTAYLRSLVDTFIWHRAPKDSFCERGLTDLQESMRADFILRVDDDEEPSLTLWDDLRTMGGGTAYTLTILCELGGRLYVRGMEKQVRAFPRGAFHFAGGMDSEMVVECPLEERPLDIIWHYSLYAPRAWREAKVARSLGMGVPKEFTTRYMWEDNLDYFVEMPIGMEEELPSLAVI